MNSVQENDRGWYMCQVRSIQPRFVSVKFKSEINNYDQPLSPSDQHRSNGSQVGLKYHFTQCETNSHGLTTSHMTI